MSQTTKNEKCCDCGSETSDYYPIGKGQTLCAQCFEDRIRRDGGLDEANLRSTVPSYQSLRR